jgi:ATP-dependent Clp protease ATP-binding subunit ClpA
MVSLGENGSMTGTRFSDLPKAVALRLKHGDWRGLYTKSTKIDPERYTEDAKAVMKQADAEVRSRGNQTLGTPHLLLGLLHAGNVRINVSFALGELPRERLVEVVDSQVQSGCVVWAPPAPVKHGETAERPRFVGMTRRVVDAYERAFQLADRRGTDQVNANLLLAALLTDRRATATRLLREAGVNINAVKRASLESA